MDEAILGHDGQLLNEAGALFAAARKCSGLSLKAVSLATKISPSHILRMESGKQDFTVTKFSRLCDALGIPVGLALECALLHTREFFQEGPITEPESIQLAMKLFGGVCSQRGVTGAAKIGENILYSEIIEWLLVTTSRIMAALLLSANPPLLARLVRCPFDPVRVKLISFADRLDPLASLSERLGIIKALKARPGFKLKSLGILDEQIVSDYIASGAYRTEHEPRFNLEKFLLSEPDTGESLEGNFQSAVESFPKKDLTKYPQEGNTDNVKPILPKLIERLRKATEERGRKTELASWLGVSPQKVTDWLSERVEPSGENTLRLLHWVEQQTCKK